MVSDNHAHKWESHLHTAYVLARKSEQHHCKLCSGCGRLMCEVGRMTFRPGYHFDNHKRLVEKLGTILDEACVEYDHDEDVVDDFTQYVRDWASRRAEARYDRADGV